MKPLNMDQLRATIEAAPPVGPVAGVTRQWLQQVERELSEGRAAQALLAAQPRMDAAKASIGAVGAR
jgi:hypothetical protein